MNVKPTVSFDFDFGFTAGGEHEGVGVTGVYATDLTREAIFEALRERRTYGTTGDRIIVDWRLDGHPMGSRPRAVDGLLPVARLRKRGEESGNGRRSNKHYQGRLFVAYLHRATLTHRTC